MEARPEAKAPDTADASECNAWYVRACARARELGEPRATPLGHHRGAPLNSQGGNLTFKLHRARRTSAPLSFKRERERGQFPHAMRISVMLVARSF